jgi:serine/threonine protein kinase
MSAPVTCDEFLDLVRRSAVLEDERLDKFASGLSDSGTALEQPKVLAERMIRDGLLTVFQAKQILVGKWRRFLLSGKYKLLEPIGAGGMGAVYLCEQIFMKRHVALKILPQDKLEDDPSALERFYREARAAGKLDHPNIVRAYDIDQDGKTHFLVMEYVEGESLQNIVAKHGKLDPDRAANYIRQAALGLQHAHEAGLVHRDIKPGNLLIDRTGTVKILDLGLARILDARKDNLTERFDGENAVLGTADYLAPEQALGGKANVDIRADIYSLGATFFFLLTGRAPFEDGTLTQKLLWHQIRKIQSVSDFRTDVPPEIVAVVDKMLSKLPDDRYTTPQELADALTPMAAPNETPPQAWMPKRSLAALTPGAQGDVQVPSGPNSRSTISRSPPMSRPSTSTPSPKTSLPPSVAPRLTAPRDYRPADSRRPRRKADASNARTKMIVLIASGSLVSLGLIFGIVYFATRKHDAKPQGASTSPPITLSPTTAPRTNSNKVATPITADQAKDHLGEYCLVEMTVKRIGKSQTRYFLNHMEEYKDPRCFTVTFEKPVFDQLKERGMVDVESYFSNKIIRVRGTVTKFKNPRDGVVSIQIDVDDASQITVQ